MELFLSASWWEWAMIIINDVCLYDKSKSWITFAYDVVFLCFPNLSWLILK